LAKNQATEPTEKGIKWPPGAVQFTDFFSVKRKLISADLSFTSWPLTGSHLNMLCSYVNKSFKNYTNDSFRYIV
jgi:hypothetical protein